MYASDACTELQKRRRVWQLNFNAACRDMTVWPTTAVWQMDLATTMRNVNSVSLRSVALHAAEYTVDAWNNTIDVQLGGTVYTVNVPLGMYASGANLATAVTAAFVATDVALANLSVAYVALTDSVVVSETTPLPFTLLWHSGPTSSTSMWATLGFQRTDLSSALSGGSHEAAGQGKIDLDGVLAVDIFADELSNSLNGPIGRVLLEQSTAGAPSFQTLVSNEHHTFWPIGRIQFLTFRFMVQYGQVESDGTVSCAYRPYEFHGRNNTLRLDFGVMSYMNPMEEEVQLDPGT